MNTFLIMFVPILLVLVSLVFLFIWGAKGKQPYQ
jgi:hypothetical protein